MSHGLDLNVARTSVDTAIPSGNGDTLIQLHVCMLHVAAGGQHSTAHRGYLDTRCLHLQDAN